MVVRMPRATLSFDLPEERFEHEICVHSLALYNALKNIRERIRAEQKADRDSVLLRELREEADDILSHLDE
jgi:hypothetical protein